MFRSFRSILFTLAFSLVVLSAATALAAPAAWQSVDVTLHAEQDGSVLLVSGDLPEKTPLPATAQLSVPAGSELQWIGEILGGPPADDLELKPTKTSANGADVYSFTLTKARTAQIEIPLTAGQLFDGTSYTSSLAWTATQDIPQVRLSLRVPQAAKPVGLPAGAALQSGQDGYSFYTKTVKNVKAGDKLDLKLVYTVPAASAATPAGNAPTQASSNQGALILAAVIAVLAFAGGAVVLSRRRGSSSAPVVSEPSSKTSSTGSSKGSAKRGPGAGDTVAAKPGMSGNAKRNLVTASIIGVLVLGTAIVGTQSTKPKLAGDTITEVFAQAESCATATIPLTVPPGTDPTATAKTLFTVLRPLSNTATYNAKTSSLEIGFCESKSSESSLRAALASTGFVAE